VARTTRLSRFLAAAPAAFLTAEFVVFDLAYYVGKPLGLDTRIYLAATQAWLSGGDPWLAGSAGFRFAGSPLTLLPIAPFAWMSSEALSVLIGIAGMASAVFVVRRLSLPYWWLLFPPLFESIWTGSVNLIVLALALTRFESLAILTKAYAALPALGRRHFRSLAIAAVVALGTIPFLPWQAFLAHDLGSVLTSQASGGRSAWIAPLLLIPISVVALVGVGRERAAWFSVPVLWPATQFHYSIFAIPAKPSALATAILAVPIPGAPVVAVATEATLRWGPRLYARFAAGRAGPRSAPQEGDSVPVQVMR